VFEGETSSSFNQKEHDKEIAALQSQFNKLLDELTLGDNKDALEMLKKFESA